MGPMEWEGAKMLKGSLVLQGDGQGHLRDVRFEDGPPAPELRANLAAAAWHADTVGDLRDGLVGDSLVRLAVEARQLPEPRDAWLMRIRLPYIRITKPAWPRYQPNPEYPNVPLAAQDEGRVTLQYVVDEDGLAVPTSIKVLKGPTGFVPSAVKTILRSRFEPPLSGSCHVKQLVQQSVMFKTRQEPWPPASDGRPPSPDH